MKHKMAKSKPNALGAIKSQLKIKAEWRPVASEPSPLWRKLWSRLLINKKEATPNQAPARDGNGKELDANE